MIYYHHCELQMNKIANSWCKKCCALEKNHTVTVKHPQQIGKPQANLPYNHKTR